MGLQILILYIQIIIDETFYLRFKVYIYTYIYIKSI